jgi:hypothetical protein
VPRDIYSLVQKVDVDVVYQQGTDAERGASGYYVNGGRFWWTTDTHKLWYDDGNTWWLATGDISGALPFTIFDAKGDLLAGVADNQGQRFPVGNNGQILVADSSTTTGLAWADRHLTYVTVPCSFNSADPPTYVMNVVGVNLTTLLGAGTRIYVLQGGVNKWFIVTGTAYAGGNTTLTMYGGTDYALQNAAITTVGFSNSKAPPGMPLAADKWTYSSEDATDRVVSSPTPQVWVWPGNSLAVPIGSWIVSYTGYIESRYSIGQGEVTDYATLSTTQNSESDKRWTSKIELRAATSNEILQIGNDVSRERALTVGVKTTYYLLAKAHDVNCQYIGFYGAGGGTTVVQARCAYL